MSGLAAINPEELGLVGIAECGPPIREPAERVWRITRHADCLAALRDASVDTIDIAEDLQVFQRKNALTLPSLATLFGGVLVARRALFHRKGRSFLRVVQAKPISTALMRQRADALLASVAPGEPVDLMPVLNQLPLLALADYIGLGRDTLDELDNLLRRIMFAWGSGPRNVSLLELETQCDEVLAILRRALADEASDDGSRLQEVVRIGMRDHDLREDEICSLLLFLVLASVETTAGSLANLVVLLQRVPGLIDLVREREDLRLAVVDEGLRIAGPVKRLGRRFAMRPLVLGGAQVPAGSALLIDIEAAHRDPAAYPEPWRLDPARKGPPSLGFSAGAHACLGARVSRQMATEVVGAVAKYEIAAATAEPPDWTQHPGFRIPSSLPSILTPRRSA